jgi:DNA adenine methylase
MTNVEKAARTIYLNKTCYNGLYRVNRKGFFNTPKGRYKNPNIVDRENLKELYFYLRKNHIQIKNTSFEKSVVDATQGDFVYFDPPYDYEGVGFTKYVKEGFGYKELTLLKKTCDKLITKGVKVLISNNATDRVLSLFDDERYQIIDPITGELYNKLYQHEKFNVRRTINAVNDDKNIVKEVLIFGFREQL